MRPEQVTSAILHLLIVAGVTESSSYGGFKLFGGSSPITVDDLEEAIREGEGRHASLSTGTTEEREAVALMDRAGLHFTAVRPDGSLATDMDYL